MTALVSRPDLSQRTILSKSAITGADWCQTRAWYDLHERRPTIQTEKLVFGSCLDAAVEQLMMAARAGIPLAEARPIDAAQEILATAPDDVEVDLDVIDTACHLFIRDVMPLYDFAHVGLQVTLHEDLAGIGEAEGHPDVRLADGSIFDVKSAKKRKYNNEAETSAELGFYALLSEAQTGKPTPRVGYWTLVRNARPVWQILETPVTDEMRRRTREVVRAFIRAKQADELLNRRAARPVNFTLTGGPRFPGLCNACTYAPAFGGPCQIASQGGVDDD